MPEMISKHRGLRVASFGHCIHLPKDVPTFVPDIVARDCLAAGAQYVDESLTPPSAERDGVESLETVTPMSMTERQDKLNAALDRIYKDNNPLEFTAAGAPKLAVVGQYAGFTITSTELKQAIARRQVLRESDEV